MTDYFRINPFGVNSIHDVLYALIKSHSFSLRCFVFLTSSLFIFSVMVQHDFKRSVWTEEEWRTRPWTVSKNKPYALRTILTEKLFLLFCVSTSFITIFKNTLCPHTSFVCTFNSLSAYLISDALSDQLHWFHWSPQASYQLPLPSGSQTFLIFKLFYEEFLACNRQWIFPTLSLKINVWSRLLHFGTFWKHSMESALFCS